MKQFLSLLFILNLFLVVFSQELTYTHSVQHAFIENKGQWPDFVHFKNRIDGGNLWVEDGRLLFQLQDYSMLEEAHLSMKEIKGPITFREKLVLVEFLGSQTSQSVEKKGKTDHYYNFFIGNDENKWASDVRGYEEFTLKELYPGIDLRFIEQGFEVKYEFRVAPQVNPNVIQLKYTGQNKLSVNKKGNLIVKTELGDVIEEKPYVYQIVNGKIIEIQSSYKVKGDIVSFELGDYNPYVELVIDPTLTFATYNGAISDNFGMTATYGHDGSAYSAGTIYGNAHPMPDPNAYDVVSNMTVVNVNIVTTDAFITKYSPDGTQLLWATFYGGGNNFIGTDVPHSLICDLDDNIYVFGTTSSLDFPIVNGFQSTFGGGTPFSVTNNGINFGNTGTDIYVAKFSANGHNLVGSTYVGGDQNDGVNYIISAGNYTSYLAYDSLTMNYGDQFRGEIILDEFNNIIVGSCTRSQNFPLKTPFQLAFGGDQDGVIFKLKHDFSELLFSSNFGGAEADAIYSVKIDNDGNIVFGGGTISTNMPILSSGYQSSYAGGKADGFIVKIRETGTSILASTYLGTSDYDQVFFVEVNHDNDIYAFGQSNGGGWPVVNAPYSIPNSSQFITKLDTDLSMIKNSTVFGNGSTAFNISPSAFMVDICGNIYTSGWGGSVLAGGTPISGMPLTPDAFQSNTDGFDFYLMVLNRDFDDILYGTYIGGTQSKDHVDGGTSRFDKNGIIYQCGCGGCGGKSDFNTTPNAWSSQNLANNCNALTFKFDFNLIPKADFEVSTLKGCNPLEVELDNSSIGADSFLWDFGGGNVDSTTVNPSYIYTEPGVYEIMLTVVDSICFITDSMKYTITVFPDIFLDVSEDLDLCVAEPITLTAYSNGTATNFLWSTNSNFTDQLNTTTTDSVVVIQVPESGYYYVKAWNGGCFVIDSVRVDFVEGGLELLGNTSICKGEQTSIMAVTTSQLVQFNNFHWSPEDIIVSGQGTQSIVIQADEGVELTLFADADSGCEVEITTQILVGDIDASAISVTASESSVPFGSEVILTAQPSGYSYTWSPSDAVYSQGASETTAVIYETTLFTVEITDGICTKSDTITVWGFPYVCDEPFIFVPNAFTPNGDGENDVLYVRSQILTEVVFRVYNRWGEKVFETNNLHIGWDGTFRGKALPPDVYDYYMEGKCLDDQDFIIKGNITLIR